MFSNLAMLCVTGVMVGWGFIQAFKFPGQVTEVMRIPISAVYIIIPLSGTVMFAHLLSSLIKGIRSVANGLPPEA